MDDVFRFAVVTKRPLGEYKISRSCETKVRPAVADQDRGESSPGVDRASDGTLADAASNLACGVSVGKRDIQTALPKPEPVRINCERNVELPQRVSDRIVEPVTHDREAGERPDIPDEA